MEVFGMVHIVPPLTDHSAWAPFFSRMIQLEYYLNDWTSTGKSATCMQKEWLAKEKEKGEKKNRT